MEKQLVIIGASGHGKVVADVALKMAKWDSVIFVDQNSSLVDCLGCPVVGVDLKAVEITENTVFFVAVGQNSTRERIQNELEQAGLEVATLIHPGAVIGSDVVVMPGTVVMAGAVVNPSTRIGRGCIINTKASVDHDNCIGDFTHLSPGVCTAGNVTIGTRSWLGIGSIISNNMTLCEDVQLGAGAVVIKSIYEPGLYIGLPAKKQP